MVEFFKNTGKKTKDGFGNIFSGTKEATKNTFKVAGALIVTGVTLGILGGLFGHD